jgi:hypothetical protein
MKDLARYLFTLSLFATVRRVGAIAAPRIANGAPVDPVDSATDRRGAAIAAELQPKDRMCW